METQNIWEILDPWTSERSSLTAIAAKKGRIAAIFQLAVAEQADFGILSDSEIIAKFNEI